MSQFTKIAIMNSFLKLLNEKNFEKITVKNIVEDCGVNRKTFYYYFEDIYDLVEQIFENEIKNLSQSITDEMSVEDTVDLFCDVIEDNKRIVTHSFFMAGEVEMRRLFYNVLCPAFENSLNRIIKDTPVTDDDKETLVRMITFSVVGSAVVWISNGFDPEEKERLKKVCVLIQSSLPMMVAELRSYNK